MNSLPFQVDNDHISTYGSDNPAQSAQQLQRVILSLSHEKHSFKVACLEWDYIGVTDNDDSDGQCECGANIRWEHHITNRVTHESIIVGSTCILKFDNPTLVQTAKNAEKELQGKIPMLNCFYCQEIGKGGCHAPCRKKWMSKIKSNALKRKHRDILEELEKYPWSKNDVKKAVQVENEQTEYIEELHRAEAERIKEKKRRIVQEQNEMRERERQRLILIEQHKENKLPIMHIREKHASMLFSKEHHFLEDIQSKSFISEHQQTWLNKIIARCQRVCSTCFREEF